MKHIVVACGAGLASSAMVVSRIEESLLERGHEVKITQARLNELSDHEGNADLFVTTMKVDREFKTPLIHGSAYLTGMNEDAVTDEIIKVLEGE